MRELVVAKFGGSSVKDAGAMQACVNVVKKNPRIRVIILSATYNTTNKLEQMAALAAEREIEKAREILTEVKKQHMEIAGLTCADEQTKEDLKRIIWEGESLLAGISLLRECSPRAMDRLYSLGERMSTRLFVGILNVSFRESGSKKRAVLLDATKIIKTNGNFNKALPQLDLIQEGVDQHLKPLLEDPEVVALTQGFIGKGPDEAITTLGREGSDFTAALIAEAVNASLLQIWTDVPGIATTDPRMVTKARFIQNITYKEASAMAHLGAKVLFPKTLNPAMRKGIPVFVGSSRNPDGGGTWISDNEQELPLFRALTMMDRQVMVRLISKNQIPAQDFFKSVMDILNLNRITYNFLNYEGTNISFLISKSCELTCEVKEQLARLAEVKLEEGLSLVSLVGNGMDSAGEQISEVFASFSRRTVKMIQLGGCSQRLSFLVPSKERDEIVNDLHDRLLLN